MENKFYKNFLLCYDICYHQESIDCSVVKMTGILYILKQILLPLMKLSNFLRISILKFKTILVHKSRLKINDKI